jgi:3-oxoacyl-[acyl-carrier protein] reductase
MRRPSMKEFDGRICVVSGATRGIGRAIAAGLHREGACVIGLGRDADLGRRLTEELPGTVFHRVDVSDGAAVESVMRSVAAEHGGIDHVVCNAGITRDALAVRMSDDDWQRVIDVNLTGTFNLLRASLRSLLKRPEASALAISSVVGETGNPGQANYAASKAAIVALCRSVAKEVGSRGVRINVLAPGFVETDMTRTLPDAVRASYLEKIPLGRAAQPDEIADVACFLLSSRASYITGQLIGVNGGLFP